MATKKQTIVKFQPEPVEFQPSPRKIIENIGKLRRLLLSYEGCKKFKQTESIKKIEAIIQKEGGILFAQLRNLRSETIPVFLCGTKDETIDEFLDRAHNFCVDIITKIEAALPKEKAAVLPAKHWQEKIAQTATERELSNPMSKSTMMTALKMHGYKKFNAFAKKYEIQRAGSRQLWQIRLDTMDKATRQKLEKAS